MPRHLIAPLVALALVAAFPLSGATFYVELTTKIMIMAIFALSLDLLVGWTGLVSFGHAAFFGVGAYALALLSPKAAAAGLWSSLGIAIGAAALCAFVVFWPSLNIQGSEARILRAITLIALGVALLMFANEVASDLLGWDA